MEYFIENIIGWRWEHTIRQEDEGGNSEEIVSKLAFGSVRLSHSFYRIYFLLIVWAANKSSQQQMCVVFMAITFTFLVQKIWAGMCECEYKNMNSEIVFCHHNAYFLRIHYFLFLNTWCDGISSYLDTHLRRKKDNSFERTLAFFSSV